jgi:hypothetical protein
VSLSAFQQAKLAIVDWADLPKDALHIYVGLAVFLAAAAVSGKSLRHWLPIGAVLAAALAGEAWDLFDTVRAGQRLRWDASWRDVWNTSFWPAILFILARTTRLLKR